MDLAAFRTSLAARVATVDPALTAYSRVPGTVVVPAAIIEIGQINVHQTFDAGDCDVPFIIHILVALSNWDTAQSQLDAYCSIGIGGKCVVDAVEDAQTTIDTISPPGTIDVGSSTYATVTFNGTALFG